MPVNFPANPTTNQVYTYNNSQWIWTGSFWQLITVEKITGATGATGIGATGATGISGNIGATGATGPAGTSANITVWDEGNLVTTSVSGIKFIGAGITANLVASNVEVTVTATGTGSGGFTYANAAPSTPVVGDRWIDTNTMIELVYVYDGTSYQWVQLTSQAPSGANRELSNLTTTSISANLVPASNITYDLGSSSQRWRDLYLSGNTMYLGAATLSATGSSIQLPAGSTVGGTVVATTSDVATGGGPKIANLQVATAAWAVLDDTAVDTAGGYIIITGSNFVSGCLVYFNQTPATSVGYVSTTTLRITVPALAAGTYVVYVINPDGGTAIRVPGMTSSATPSWVTGSSLPEQTDNVAIILSLVATSAVSYALSSGSLPPGLSLNANTGVITGTVTSVTVDTSYTFTVTATDAELQDSPRTFTVTIAVSDPYFRYTTLLLSGSAISGNTVIRDSSNNASTLVVYGDTRASNFTPYGSGWSNLFNSNRLNIVTTGFAPGTGNFTVEAWIYPTSYNSASAVLTVTTTGGLWLGKLNSNWVLRAYSVADQLTTTTLPTLNTWTHVAWVRNGSTATIYFNGNSVVSGTVTYNFVSGNLAIGDDGGGGSYFLGYISNLRYTTTAVYTANFTPATTNLTALAETQLLTCRDNRFRDTSSNAYTITTTGTPTVSSFNPFNITNTGVNGSMYFDGNGDYIAWSPATTIQFGTGDFTVEAWTYTTNSAIGMYIIDGRNSGQTGVWALYLNVSYWWFNGSAAITGGTVIANQWAHVVYVRSGTTGSLYVNGARVATQTDSTNYSVMPTTSYIGNRYNQVDYWVGYMSNIRIIKGTAAYDPTLTTLTVPTVPLTAVTNTQLLTLQYDQPHNNHTFLDSSSNQFLITRNGNASQGTFSPFSPGGWSNYFDGAGDLLQIANNAAFEFGTGDFTIECWAYPISFGNNFTLYINWNGSGPAGRFGIALNATGISVDTTYGMALSFSGTTTVNLNSWYHIAFVRSGSSFKTYINGVQISSATSSATYAPTGYPVSIGDYTDDYTTGYGYISNLRVIKGSAVYTANFTPPTGPLTAIAGTSLLTCQSNRFRDFSTNNFAMTVSGTPSVQAFSPFAPSAKYAPEAHGGSAYFDRTGDFLSLATNNSFDFGTGNFTVELFYYPLAYDDIQMFFSGTSNYQFGYSATDSRNLYYYGSSGGNVISGTPAASMLLNQWNHIVLVRSGTSLAIMSNGVRQGTATHSSSVNFSGSPIVGGYADNTALYAIRGYIAGFRAVKGVAIYDPTQTTYTVPAAPVTATVNTSLLLNFTDAAILDSTGRNLIETVADAKTSSVITKFTGGSMYFDGTGDRLVLPASPNLTFGTSDFTIEMWVNSAAQASNSARIMGNGAGGSWGANKWIFTSTTASNPNKYSFQFWNYNSGGSDLLVSSSIANNSTWTHVAITRSGSTFRMFVNGTLEATQTSANSLDGSSSVYLEIGRSGLTGEDWAGYINDLRITRGYARYTANFTPPTVAHRLR